MKNKLHVVEIIIILIMLLMVCGCTTEQNNSDVIATIFIGIEM